MKRECRMTTLLREVTSGGNILRTQRKGKMMFSSAAYGSMAIKLESRAQALYYEYFHHPGCGMAHELS